MMRKTLSVLVVLSTTLWFSPSLAQQIDPHILYEQNCSGCHVAHAGDFVFETLDTHEGTLISKKTGSPVRPLLEAGHGRLSTEEIEVMIDHLLGIKQSGQIFLRKCRTCHNRAHELARLKLIIRDEKLVGRYTDRDIEKFLLTHGRLNPEEVETMVDVFKRQFFDGTDQRTQETTTTSDDL